MTSMKNLTIILLLAVSAANCYRLPTIYSPSLYSISLVLLSDIFTTENTTAYTGTVQITLTASESVSQIILHASSTYINVTSAGLVSGTTEYSISDYSVNSTTDILTLALASAMVINQTYVLTLNFDGRLSNTDMYGFYKSSYTDSTNTTYYLATTQMESTYARRAFPCFDEPRYKANFSISLTYPSELNALANMDVSTSTAYNNGTTKTVFNTTPRMSTYLVAFTVSSFTCSNGTMIEGTLTNQVCSRNETSSIREFALEVAPRVINHLNSYLSINYSLNMDKLDQVAIPDFSAGAMENWGLVTYRERALLYEANETSTAIKKDIAAIIAHELAHQWFGNLVTCKWWSEIFLNEGFATFFEFFLTHELFPEFDMDEEFVIKTLEYILEEDASTTEALRTNATTSSQISARFSGISYDKGASILRMVQHIMGIDLWKTALNSYLTQFAYSSAEPDDLWNVLGSYINTTLPADLATIMTNWIDFPGYPVVNVSFNGGQLTLKQRRFVLKNTTDTNTTWYVPVTYTTSENTLTFLTTSPMAWISPSLDLTLNISANVSWIVLNNIQTGYYRVNYDSALWASLATALQQTNHSNIPELNRCQLIDDALNLARGGYINYSQAFSILDFLANETSYTVWYPAFRGFQYLLKRFGLNSTLGAAISNHILNLTVTLRTDVPLAVIDAPKHIYSLNQVQTQTWACKLGDSNCTTEAVRLFEEYKNTSVRPEKNLRPVVYCYGLKYSSDVSADWEFLWNAFLNASLPTEQGTILAALGCPNNEAILQTYLEKTLTDGSGIRSQDYASVFAAVYQGSVTGVDTALDFFINNYDAIISRYVSMNGVANIIKGISDQLTTNAQIIKLQNLIGSNVLNGTVLEAASTALTSAQNNYQWVNTYKSSLNSYYGIGDETTAATSTTTQATSTVSSADSPYLSLVLVALGLFVRMF